MSRSTSTAAHRLALTALGVVGVGVAAFLLTGVVVGDDDDAARPWVVPLSSPTSSIDLDPELPILQALTVGTEEAGLVAEAEEDEPAIVESEADAVGAASDAALRDALGLEDDEPLSEALLASVPAEMLAELRGESEGIWGPGARAANVNLTALGRGPAPSAPVGDDPDDPSDDPWGAVDPTMPFVARELDEGSADVDGDAEGELGDPVELDALFADLLGRGGLDIRIVDDVPLLELDLPTTEPDFLDACAAEIDGALLDCGPGIGGTVLPIVPPLEILSVAIDNGSRCPAGSLDGDGLPVRISLNRPVTQLTVTWQGSGDDAVLTRHVLDVSDTGRVGDHGPGVVWHECTRLPLDATSLRYTAEVQAVDIFWQLASSTVELSRPPWLTEGRPPTILEPVGDRRLLVHVPARQDGTVRAHVVVRDPDQVGFASQCDPTELTAEVTDWGRWAEPGAPVRVRPAHRLPFTPAAGFDPSYDRSLVYDLSFRPIDLDRPMASFELCLTWLDASGGTLQPVEREHHLIAPPARPVVDVYAEGGGLVDAGSDREAFVSVEIRQTGAATNGTTLGDGSRRFLINDVRRPCVRRYDREQLARITEPEPVCRFELTDERRDVLLASRVFTGRDGRTTSAYEHARLAPLPGSPSHPRRTAGCDRCADSHTVPGWLTAEAEARGQRPDAHVRLRFVTSGDAFEPWVTLPLFTESVLPDQPVLDVTRTTIERAEDDPVRGIVLRYEADRPVQVRWVARPSASGRADGTPPPGCPAASVPHVAASDGVATAGTLVIDDACALTDYRFALELTDERGERAVYGDLLSWLVAQRVGADLLAGDEAYVPTSWRPRLRTQGHQWLISTDAQVTLAVGDPPTGGVFVGEAAGAAVSLRRDRPTGSVHDMSRLELSEAVVYSRGRNTFLQRLQVDVGAASTVHGRAGGDGRRCLDPVARFGPQSRYVQVGDLVAIRAGGEVQWRASGCGENLLVGNRLYEAPRLELPPAPDSATRSTTYLVPSEELAQAGRVRLVLRSEPRCVYWSSPTPPECHDGSVPWWSHEALVTLTITPDRPPSRTLIGGFG